MVPSDTDSPRGGTEISGIKALAEVWMLRPKAGHACCKQPGICHPHCARAAAGLPSKDVNMFISRRPGAGLMQTLSLTGQRKLPASDAWGISLAGCIISVVRMAFCMQAQAHHGCALVAASTDCSSRPDTNTGCRGPAGAFACSGAGAAWPAASNSTFREVPWRPRSKANSLRWCAHTHVPPSA
jgi:hypothetical protein